MKDSLVQAVKVKKQKGCDNIRLTTQCKIYAAICGSAGELIDLVSSTRNGPCIQYKASGGVCVT